MKLLHLTFLIALIYAEDSPDPLSDEFIEHINKQNLSWRAGRNFQKSLRLSDIKGLLGVLPSQHKHQLKTVRPSKDYNNTVIPIAFDARKNWSNCESIRTIRDQSNCGACWAFASVEAMSDRICIFSNQTRQTSVSAEDLLSCCGGQCGRGCNGGYPIEAWVYWNTAGIVTGGSFEKYDGCKAYSISPCSHNKTGIFKNCTGLADTPKCTRKCDEIGLNYTSEKTYGKKPYNIIAYERDIQLEIMKNGPVVATFDVYDDFFAYKGGVYIKTNRTKWVGQHAVKILGWGVEKNISYWLIANSWNADWGEKGFFKMFRGNDHCGIESSIIAGIPDFRTNNTKPDYNSHATVPTNSIVFIISGIFLWFIFRNTATSSK